MSLRHDRYLGHNFVNLDAYSPISRRIFPIPCLPEPLQAGMTAETYPHRLVYYLKSYNMAIVMR
jgi:hypothetical protein